MAPRKEEDDGCTHVSSHTKMVTLSQQMPARGAGDLELRLLQAFSEYAGHGIVRSYAYVKHSSRVLGFAASATETVVTKTGLVALVRFFYNQYLRLGHPLVRYVDDAVGRCVVGAFVRILLAVEYQQSDGSHRLVTATGEPLELTFYERLQALLYGQVPRLQSLIVELQAREEELKTQPPPVAINLDDFVPKEEVKRLEHESREALALKEKEVLALKREVEAAERARRQLGQDMETADATSKSESQKLLLEKQQQISTLGEQVQAAERERAALQREVERLQQHSSNDLMEKECKITRLQEDVQAAERARLHLEQELRNLKTNEKTEALAQLTEKEQEIGALKELVLAAEREREQLKKELDSAHEQRASEHQQVVAQKEAEMDILKEKVEVAERARKQLQENLREALDIKETESRAALEVKEREVATLMSEVETAASVRKQMEQEFEAERVRMESEHSQRVKTLEEELEHAKQDAFDKGHELRSMTLRQQRASGNGSILIKDFVEQAKGPAEAHVVSDNQRDEQELSQRTASSRSSPASSIASTSPRTSATGETDENKLKSAIEKQKLAVRMHRVFGSRF